MSRGLRPPPPGRESHAEDNPKFSAGFPTNYDHLLARWPRFIELHQWANSQGSGARRDSSFADATGATCNCYRSSPGWTRNICKPDPVVSRLARKGADYTEQEKQQLSEKQIELLDAFLPEYRKRAAPVK